MKAPNPKHQTPEKLQTPKSKGSKDSLVRTITGSPHAIVALLIHKDNGNVLIVHQCPCNGIVTLATEFGSPTRLTGEEFRQKGLEIILKSFSEYIERKKTALSDLESLSPSEGDRVQREHFHIHLTIYDQNGLAIQPLRRSSSGKTYGGTNKEAVFLRFPFSNEEFIDSVDRALREAE